MPDILHIEREKGWRYFPTRISNDGRYVLAVAINDGRCQVCLGTEPGEPLDVYFKLKNNNDGRVYRVLTYIGLKDLGDEKSIFDENLNEGKDEDAFVLYPNPARDLVYIHRATSEEATLTVYDHLGKIVDQQEISTSHDALDISGLLPGLYIVKANSAQYSITKTIMVY
ncbi:MAG: T9SS type A sorting domain-containing protein [Bacteroidales bacterium]|nr:T9SS type A sorting domain-containing protein [Bacteroidales bacterium]